MASNSGRRESFDIVGLQHVELKEGESHSTLVSCYRRRILYVSYVTLLLSWLYFLSLKAVLLSLTSCDREAPPKDLVRHCTPVCLFLNYLLELSQLTERLKPHDWMTSFMP